MNAQPKIEAGAPLVFQKIAAVQGELARSGIGKDSENTFDRYKFRGIDAVYNALAPLLAKHGLCVLPRIMERDCQERVSRKGEPMFYVTVTAEFDFVAAEDGSIHTVRTYGEAMDRSDKATNKAMSAAYKYAAFMTFAIPTEGDNDADATTPEVAAAGGSERDNSEARQVSPTGTATDYQDALTKIISLCEAIGGGQSQIICDAYKIKDIRELTSRQAEKVIDRLEEKLAEKVSAETNAKAEITEEIVPF